MSINLHVSGSASLTPDGGFMSLTYVYNASSLLGSSALGLFQFNFFEDPGRGLHANVQGSASFVDAHTGVEVDPTVHIVDQVFNAGIVAFGADLQITSFIGGCTVVNCDLSQGVFADFQSLSAELDPAQDGSQQGLDSLNTFRVTITSDLPLVSADGRTAGAAAAVEAPEPGPFGLVLVSGVVAAWFGRLRQQRRPA